MDNKVKRELTKAEFEVMKSIWSGSEMMFMVDIVEGMEEPRPAYTTVSTIVRTLVAKGFVGYKVFSKVHGYFPLVSKEEYSHLVVNKLRINLFKGSMAGMLSFFAKKEALSTEERAEIIELLKSEM